MVCDQLQVSFVHKHTIINTGFTVHRVYPPSYIVWIMYFIFPLHVLKNIYIYIPGFVPFFEQKLQGLYKDFQGHISHFSRTPFSAKKRFESMSFLVLPQHEQFYPEGLSY